MLKRKNVLILIALCLVCALSGCTPAQLHKLNQDLASIGASVEVNGSRGYPDQIVIVKEAVIEANVRAEPSVQAQLITTIQGGTQLQKIGQDETGQWSLLALGNGQGWMDSENLEELQ